MPHVLPDPTEISRVPYKILGLFQTLGGTRENRELLNANLREIDVRVLWDEGDTGGVADQRRYAVSSMRYNG